MCVCVYNICVLFVFDYMFVCVFISFSTSCENLPFRVGLDMPTIEVRFEHLTVETEAYVGSRALPTMFNFSANMFEV